MKLPIEILNIIYLYTIDLNLIEFENTNNRVIALNNEINRYLLHIEQLNNDIDRHLFRRYHISNINRSCDIFIIICLFLLYQIVLMAFTGYFYDSYWRTPNTILFIFITIYLLQMGSNLQCYRDWHIR